MKHSYIITTDRLRFRQIEPGDLECVRIWRNNDLTRKWFLDNSIITPEQQLIWYKNYIDNNRDIMFIIEEMVNINAPIGTIALYNIDTDRQTTDAGRLMIGNPEVRNRGFGLESLKAMCDFAFYQLGIKKIRCEVFEDNFSSMKMSKNAGFKIIDTYFKNGDKVIVIELVCNS